MRTKLVIVVVALLLGGVAAVMAVRYLSSARTEIASGSKPVEILVAKEDIPRGITAEELIAKKMVSLEQVPQRFVAAGAISTPRAIEGEVLSTPLTRGEQLTTSRFQVPSDAGLAYSIPRAFLAIAIPVDDVKGISGLVRPGDHVAVFATFESGPDGGADVTKLLISDAKVLAMGGSLTAEDSGTSTQGKQKTALAASRSDEKSAPRTMTLAVRAKEAEKIVFAEEVGKVWVTLLPATSDAAPSAPGTTIKTIFR